MVVAIAPLDIVEGQPEINLNKVESYLRHVREDADIFVLPELFSTGFPKDEAVMQLIAEPQEGLTISRLKELAYSRSIAIAGTYLCRDDRDGTLKNRAFFINPDNDCNVTAYDKRHLFTISPEHKLLKPGMSKLPVTGFRGWNIALAICFDIRFPVWCRNVGNEYDMMIVPANWPDSRYSAWKHLLIARAIENVAAYVGCNRSGIDLFGTYSYLSSFAVDHRGNIVSEIHGNSPVRYASFSLESLRDFRRKFPVHHSADKFTIDDIV